MMEWKGKGEIEGKEGGRKRLRPIGVSVAGVPFPSLPAPHPLPPFTPRILSILPPPPPFLRLLSRLDFVDVLQPWREA